MACRLFRKAVQQGRSERRGESYFVPYIEPLRDARTLLAGFVNSLIITPHCLRARPPALLRRPTLHRPGHLKHRQIHNDDDRTHQDAHYQEQCRFNPRR